MELSKLKPGQSAKVVSLGGQGALRQHFLDMGILPETEMTLVKLAPMGDPMEFRLHGYELTLRVSDAKNIKVKPIESATEQTPTAKPEAIEHPGLGEDGKYHKKGSGNPLPEGTRLKFALVGNQNSG